MNTKLLRRIMFGLCLVILIATFGMITSSRALAQVSNPVPFISQPLVPTTVAPGGSAFTLTVNGAAFVQGSVVNWNGSPRATTFVSQSQLTVAILASDVAAPGTASIAVTNPGVGTVSNTSFLSTTWPVSSVSLVSSPIPSGSGQAVADFNGDGKLDLAGFGNGFLTVNLGNGDGTFQSSTIYPLAQNDPSTLAVGDFNGDGKMDIAVAFGVNGPPYVVTVMLGNGDGTFQAPSQAAAIEYNPLSMAAADFNGDGKLDLAVANYDRTVSLLQGNGDGTFQPQTVITLGSGFIGEEAIAVGDFNGDGKLDLAVSTVASTVGQTWQILILLGNGDGTFQPPASFPTSGIGLSSIAVADVNGDGKLDLVAASDCQPTDGGCEGLIVTPGAASVLLGNGDGTFQPSVLYTTGFQAQSVAVADINGDGIPDLIVGTRCGDDPQCQFPYQTYPISILLGDGDGTFQPQLQPTAGYVTPLSAIVDLNDDGLLDMIAPSASAVLQSTLLQPTTSLTFASQTVGTSSLPQPSILSNVSTKVPITISSAQVSGTNASDFAVKTTCSKLQPKSACQVSVTFTPTGSGIRTATVLVTDSAVGSPHQITVSGTGTAPVVSLSSTAMNFGTQTVGIRSPIHSLNLTNTGNGTLGISSITASGDFTDTSNCGQKLNPGKSCKISVAFRPSKVGARRGTLTILDDAAGGSQTVALTGTGK